MPSTCNPPRARPRAVGAVPDRFITIRIPGPAAAPAEVAPAAPTGTVSPAAPATVQAGPAATSRVPPESADWSALSGLIALAAPGALVVRRILRTASAP